MANPEELKSWIIMNFAELGFRAERTTWFKSFFPEFSDVVVRFDSADGRNFMGWGYGNSDDTAIAKATAEMIERLVMRERKFATSNGMAAHLTSELAAKAASQELLERDLFLCHFYSRSPFLPINNRPEAFASFREWLSKHKVDLLLFQLGKNGCVCVIDGRRSENPFGFIICTAIKENSSDSLLSAAIPACRSVHRLLTGKDPLSPLTLEDFLSISSPSFLDHGRLALNLEYANQIAFLFSETSSVHLLEESKAELEVDTFEVSDVRFRDCPLVVARATSSHIQDLFLGVPTPEKVNLSRLSEAVGHGVQWEDLMHLPHPID